MASTAKRIVLELLSASPGHEGSSAALVACGDLLGISENNVRVTLARLVAAGTLETSSRGTYRLAESAITRHVTAWRELEKLVRRWDGGWACVQLQPLTDRTAARHRARALKLLGFRTLARSLDVRPDNLAGGVPALRERLVELGLDRFSATPRVAARSGEAGPFDRSSATPRVAARSGEAGPFDRDALVFRATELSDDARARTLWDAERLTESYIHTTERIERWLAKTEQEPRAAAREAFFFGGNVLRQVIFDPRLPEPLVDVAARKTMLDAAARLDTHGRRLWARLFGQEEMHRVA